MTTFADPDLAAKQTKPQTTVEPDPDSNAGTAAQQAPNDNVLIKWVSQLLQKDNSKDEPDSVRFPKRVQQAGANANETSAPGAGILSVDTKLKPPGQFKTGNAYGDKGLACDDGQVRDGCLLDGDARKRIVSVYHGRVIAAQLAYTTALTKADMEERLNKEPEKADWFMELTLDVIGNLVSKTVVKAFRALRAGGHVAEATADAAQLASQLSGQDESYFPDAVSTTVAAGRRALPKKEERKEQSAGNELSPKQAANVGYLGILEEQSGTIFEHLREQMIAGISDSALLVLFESFLASNGHTIAAYKAEIEQKLARFETSGLRTLGTKKNETYRCHPILGPGDGLNSFATHETKVFWVKTPIGRRLAFYKRAHKPVSDREFDGKITVLRDRFQMEAAKLRDLIDRPFQFTGYVPTEFVDVATKMHTAAWGHEPMDHVAGMHELMQMGSDS